jgi:flagellar motor switch protein FliM
VADLDRLEAQALMDAMQPERADAPVAPRDFRVPNRLGAERVREIGRSLSPLLTELATGLGAWLERPVQLGLVEVCEVDARAVLGAAETPCMALAFRLAKAKEAAAGWLFWEFEAAAHAAEVALGGPLRELVRETPLSRIECKLLIEMCRPIAERAARALGLELADHAVMSTAEEVREALEQLAKGDAQRLSVTLDVQGFGAASSMRLVLPGVVPAAARRADPPPALPEHLGDVQVELGALLGSVEIPLSELLELEPGDVIPLGVEVGGLLTVQVENRRCASAHWGLKDGRVVLRLQELDLEFDEEC